MMLSFLNSNETKRNKSCMLCSERLTDVISSPDSCKDLFHYKCLRKYADDRLNKKKAIICPEKSCRKIFARIANKLKNSADIIYQNIVLSTDENQCCICFSKYKIPIASSDCCAHSFCFDCIKKWCTFKHECPMDRMPIKLLLLSDFPGGHIINKVEPPKIEEDLNVDENIDELINTNCEICNSGQDEDQLLLCDHCNKGYHIYCLSDPLSSIPEGDWFCEDCQAYTRISQDNDVVPGRRLPRRLGGVVSDLETRFARQDTLRNRRLPINETVTRRSSTSRRRVNNRNAETQNFSDEESFSDEDIISARIEDLPTYRREIMIEDGLRTRSGTRLVINDDEISEEDDEMTLEDSFDSETEKLRRVSRMETRSSNTHELMQGSLSSEIDSENELSRKKRKFESYSSSDESSDSSLDNDNAGTSSSPIITRQRKRDNRTLQSIKNKPLTREKNILKIIEEESDCGDVPSTSNRRRRLIIHSDSTNEECKRSRIKQIPTASTDKYLKTRNKESTSMSILERVKKARNKKIKAARLSTGTTGVKRSTSRKHRVTKPKSKRSYRASGSKKSKKTKKNKKRVAKRHIINKIPKRKIKMYISKQIDFPISRNKLSITSRENNLPFVSDDESIDKQKSFSLDSFINKDSFNQNNNILSEIDDSQNNLRCMTLSTINRLSDGTVIHKSRETYKSISEIQNIPNTLIQTTSSSKGISQKSSKEFNDIIDKQSKDNQQSSIKVNYNPKNLIQSTFSVKTTSQQSSNDVNTAFKSQLHESLLSIPKIQNTSRNLLQATFSTQSIPKYCSIDTAGNIKSNEKQKLIQELNNISLNFTDDVVPFNEGNKKCDSNNNSISVTTTMSMVNRSSTLKEIIHNSNSSQPNIKNVKFLSESNDKNMPTNLTHQSANKDLKINYLKKKPMNEFYIKGNNVEDVIVSGDNAKHISFSLDMPSTSQEVLDSSTTVNSSNTTLKYISNALFSFYKEHKINKEELNSLNNRILEKILKKDCIPRESNIKRFVVKYMQFYLNKKKQSATK